MAVASTCCSKAVGRASRALLGLVPHHLPWQTGFGDCVAPQGRGSGGGPLSPSYIMSPIPVENRLCVADGWRAARQAICQSKPKPCPARTHMADCGSAHHTDGRRGAVTIKVTCDLYRSSKGLWDCRRCSMVRGTREECRVQLVDTPEAVPQG